MPAGGSGFGGLLRRLSEATGELTAGLSSRIGAMVDTLRTGVVGRTLGTDADTARAIERAGTPSESSTGNIEPAPATGLQIPDLSSLPPLNTLLDVPPRQATSALLGEKLKGMEQAYGPYMVKLRSADYMHERDRSVYGFIYNGTVLDRRGDRVGNFYGRVIRDPIDGRIYVYDQWLRLRPDARGKGFSTAFSAALENYYRRSGVDSIFLNGGYTAAKAGYDWNLRSRVWDRSILDLRAQWRKEMWELSEADRVTVGTKLDRFDGPIADWPSPLELVSLSGDDPALGKRLMEETFWPGVKKL